MRRDGWILRLRPESAAPLRLFCFPFAGVGPSVYRAWPAELGPGVDVCGVAPPGREGRFVEPAFTRLEPLIDALYPAILPFLDRPFAFFGHSLGSLVSFELTRRLRREKQPLPAHLFVSGRRAPQLPIREERYHLLGDEELTATLRTYNGTPGAALEHAELMELMLPILRADFAVHETYEHVVEAPLEVPISAFGGVGDPTVPAERLEAWTAQTTKAFQLRLLPGDHFYLNAGRSDVIRAMASDLARR
jgi:medium-chain acyl-[acyl-carrier-protein] hydrolase